MHRAVVPKGLVSTNLGIGQLVSRAGLRIRTGALRIKVKLVDLSEQAATISMSRKHITP